MCLDHIIAHKEFQFYIALPLKLVPTCFTKQRGTSRTQRIQVHICFLGLPNEIFGIWGLVINRWKGHENTFPTVYYMPHNL